MPAGCGAALVQCSTPVRTLPVIKGIVIYYHVVDTVNRLQPAVGRTAAPSVSTFVTPSRVGPAPPAAPPQTTDLSSTTKHPGSNVLAKNCIGPTDVSSGPADEVYFYGLNIGWNLP